MYFFKKFEHTNLQRFQLFEINQWCKIPVGVETEAYMVC